MCGIIGYIGNGEAGKVVITALRRAETRGYHGFGAAVREKDGTITIRKKGGEDCLKAFEDLLEEQPLPYANEGIGHNRWATHGGPSDINSHPHYSSDGSILLAHNGIIENADILLKEMVDRNFPVTLVSETDTEILANWIAFIRFTSGLQLKDALQLAFTQVQGTYAIVCMDRDTPGTIYAAVCGRTLRIGIGAGPEPAEYFVASEVQQFIEHTQNFVTVLSNRIVVLTKNGYNLYSFEGVQDYPIIQQIEAEMSAIEKGDHPFWMHKEIMEQPRVIEQVMQGRVRPQDTHIYLKGISEYEQLLSKAERIFVVAHGTSFYSALFFKYLFEEHTGILVNVELASEFRYRKKNIKRNDIVIGISQSGETADTIGALENAKELGAIILGICNVEGSHIAGMTDAGVFLRAGRELGVASTKAFTSQLVTLAMLTLHVAYLRQSIRESDYQLLFNGIKSLPVYMERVLNMNERVIAEVVEKYQHTHSMYYLGRGINYPVASEGALKLKEIAGIHAEGYSASEMKHGPIGLIGPDMPVIVIATDGETFSKIVNSVKEAKARKAPIIAIVSEGCDYAVLQADDYIVVPKVLEPLSPIINVIPLQLFAYAMALKKGKNPDKPEGLAKSVTVE